MSKTILLEQATRVEGNARIRIDVEEGRVRRAHLAAPEFRGFEKFVQGRSVSALPALVSRICGLCSVAHQVASLRAVEEALSVAVPPGVQALRDAMVLGEWINSHALSCFFLSLPDFVGARGGVFELLRTQPAVTAEAFSLREGGQRIVEGLGKRSPHPVSLCVGGFLVPPSAAEVAEAARAAREVLERSGRLIREAGARGFAPGGLALPGDAPLNLLAYGGLHGKETVAVRDAGGAVTAEFRREEFPEKVSEIRAEWTLAKFPYLASLGFPRGILLTGPLARIFEERGALSDPAIAGLELAGFLREKRAFTLEDFDECRLLEIYWAARRILELLGGASLESTRAEADLAGSGQGLGILEAPRGTLVHQVLVSQGRVERLHLLVATQFNNAILNQMIRDLAGRHLAGDALSPEGERALSRCVRQFDPCMSCATH
jgi:NAD-reducing hydrogenase large subunit